MQKRSTIKQRLTLLITAPLIALVLLGGILVIESYQHYREALQTQSLLKVVVASGNLIHTLQIERGATAGFIQSGGVKFKQELPTIRQKTDEMLKAFQQEQSEISTQKLPELAASITQSNDLLSAISNLRNRTDKHAIALPEHVSSYTKTIASLLKPIGIINQQNTDASISQQVLAYLAFVQAKEQAGQERALTTAAFSSSEITPELFRQIIERHFRQEAYFDLFMGMASADEQAATTSVLSGEAAKQVQVMRENLYRSTSDPSAKSDPQVWFKTITEKIDGLHNVEQLIAKNIGDAAGQIVSTSRIELLGFTALVFVSLSTMLGIAIWVSISVSRPLKAEITVAEFAIKENDFSQRVPEDGPLEVVRAGRAFNELMAEFRDIIAEVKNSSLRITGAAHELSSSSHIVQESSSSQAESASAVAASVEEASTSLSETAANAQTATEVTTQAQQDTEEATEVMTKAVRTMKLIAELINTASANVTQLSASSEKIGGIIAVIREIADQTNLLALNAAIEAARAGEQGRGFAVVADEVRKLAERTGKATQEIGDLIGVIQSGISTAVSSMHSADVKAVESLSLVGETESALQRIGQGSEQVSNCVGAISNALNELDSAIHEIANHVEKIASMTEENNKAAEANYSTAQVLDKLSEELRDSVAQYKI